MRYLNEMFTQQNDPDLIELLNDIKKLTDECLVYLIDDNSFKWDIDLYRSFGEYKIQVKFYNKDKFFTWNSIKDDFIPYIEMLNEKFLIYDDYSFPFSISTIYNTGVIPFDDLVNDSIWFLTENNTIREIEFKIKDYKNGSN